jgi:Mat/Ecp fimbriae major subunit
MPKNRSTALICTALWLTLAAAEAAAAPTIQATAQALEFGGIASGAGGGTVTQPATGSRTTTGTVLAISSMSGQPARFDLTDDNTGCSVELPANGNVSLTGPGQATMAVSGFASSPGSPFTTQQSSVFVGATLNVGANQAPGAYSGSFTVTLTCD